MNFIKKNLIFKKENIYVILVILLIFFLDRYAKIKIINNFSDDIYYINNFINLNLIWNSGIGFGLLNFDSSLIYNLISFLIGSVIIFLFYYSITLKKTEKLIFSIIIGGALGNFYDRLSYNGVPDFIDLHYGNFHWFTFNVADIFISIAILAFIINGFFAKTDK
jgi:signal peptidase II